ncbi:hypothetical protein [Streptomyces clavuligerus]|uniref:hypothetical protein n=1 Tax=Streptomyces clavuligerus TaxID=1901 RepID=UPI00146A1244|nr:hypothetical protein [Streptomyces clavuligerus]
MPGAIAVLSLRTDTWWMLEGPVARIWAGTVGGEDLDTLAGELTGPAGDPAATRSAIGTTLAQLRSAGLLTRTRARRSWWGWWR